jgi:hypothetical protein
MRTETFLIRLSSINVNSQAKLAGPTNQAQFPFLSPNDWPPYHAQETQNEPLP